MKKIVSLLAFIIMLLSMCGSAFANEFVFDPYEIMGTDLNIEQKYKFETVYVKDSTTGMIFFDVNIPDQKDPYHDLYDVYPNVIYQYNVPENGLVMDEGIMMISVTELKKVYGYGTKFENDNFYYKYNEYLFYDPSNGENPTQVWREDVVATHEIVVSGVKEGANAFTVSTDGVAAEVQLDTAVKTINGELYVPFFEFAGKALNMNVQHEGEYTALRKTFTEKKGTFAAEKIAQMELCLSDTEYKATGNRWFLYYLEEINKLMPYQVYIPVSYDPAVPNKFVVQFHGGSGNENAVLSRLTGETGISIERYADKYGYMIMLPNAIISSSWGNKKSDDPATQAVIGYAEIGVYRSMEGVFSCYNVDMDALFVMGNSMGSTGTVYFATNNTRYKDNDWQFRAAAPAGGNGFNDEITIPMLWTWGERDGFEKRVSDYTGKWSEHYRDISTVIVYEHGHHSWSHGCATVDIVYNFFDSVLNGTYGQPAPYAAANFEEGSKATVTKVDGTEEEYTLKHAAFYSGYYNEVLMVSLTDLEDIFGIKAWQMLDNPKIGWNFYGTVDPEVNGGQGLRTYRNTICLIYGNKTCNIEMDISKLGGGTTTFEGNGITEIRRAVYTGEGKTFIRYPDFSEGVLPAAPIAIDGEVYVPVNEILAAFGI